MIQETKVAEVISNMQGERVAMGVREEDMGHIMSVLTDLYKNRLRAILREYPTNASDAHVEAGVALPIEVTLPNALTPTFKVRDYGTGLDAEGIRQVYSQYGRSTKRATNDQVGMLGLGSKSALTYSDQFTVVSVKDGRRITVLVSRDEEGVGSMQILGDANGVPTDDASGTEISVSIRREDIGRAATEAADLYSFWPEGTILVNGEQPEHFTKRLNCLKLTDSLFITTEAQTDLVVMGNVSYPQALNVGGSGRFHVVALVPIGSVKPTPARESLVDTPTTKATIQGVKDNYATAINGAIQREIDSATSPHEAVKIAVDWAQYVPGGKIESYVYKGHAMPRAFVPKNPVTRQRARYYRTETGLETTQIDGYYGKGRTSIVESLSIGEWASTVWVSDFEPGKFNATHKHKLLKWMRENNINANRVVKRFALLRESAPDSIFVDRSMVVPWATIKAIRLDPPTPRYGSSRLPGSFDVYTENGHQEGVPGDQLRQGKPFMWARGNYVDNRRYYEACASIFPAFTLVLLPANRVAKFTREAPKCKPVVDGLTEAYKTFVAGVNKDDLTALAMYDADVQGSYAALEPSKVKDPELRRYVKIAKRPVAKLVAKRKAFQYVINSANLAAGIKFEPVLDRYPLYWSEKATHEHTYLYLNAAYAAALTAAAG